MRLHIVLALLLVIGTAAYGISRAQTTLFGPELAIYSPKPNAVVPQIFTLQGFAEHAVYLTVNDQRIFPNPDGFFEKKMLLPVGDSIVEVYAESRQKRETIIHLPLTITAYDINEENSEDER